MRVQIYNFYMKLLKKSGGLNSLFAFLLRLFNAARALLAQFLAIIPLFVGFFDGCACLRGRGGMAGCIQLVEKCSNQGK
jgi:hypothetical protein